MPATGLNHVNFRAPRELLEQLKDFYCEIVGLKAGARPPFGTFGYWLYAGDHPVVHLSEAGEDENRSALAVNTYDHVSFDCRDPAAMEQTLTARGLKHRVAKVPGTDQTQIFLRDPAGNVVELNFSGGK